MKRKPIPDLDSATTVLCSPSTEARVTRKRQREVLYVRFDDEPTEERIVLDLLNLKLSSTYYHSVTVMNEESICSKRPHVGAFVYFCSRSQTEHIWRTFLTAHFEQRRFGPTIHIRTCRKLNKKIREDDLEDEELARNLDKLGCFGSSQLSECCVIIPIHEEAPSNLLFRGSAVISALNLMNEPLYYRSSSLPWDSYCEQDVHKREATIKVERINGQTNLYTLKGIRWSKVCL
jgi:hypothetical protein